MQIFKNEEISAYTYTPSEGESGLYFDENGIAMRIDASGNTFVVGDGSGITSMSLNDLTNVTITNPIINDVLTYSLNGISYPCSRIGPVEYRVTGIDLTSILNTGQTVYFYKNDGTYRGTDTIASIEYTGGNTVIGTLTFNSSTELIRTSLLSYSWINSGANYYTKAETYTKAEVLDANHFMFYLQTATTTTNILGFVSDYAIITNIDISGYTGQFGTIGMILTITGSTSNDGNYTIASIDFISFSTVYVYVNEVFTDSGDTTGTANVDVLLETQTITHNLNTLYPSTKQWFSATTPYTKNWVRLTTYNTIYEITDANNITINRYDAVNDYHFGIVYNPYMISKF